MSFDRVLIANRGEIVARIARTARRMGITSVAVFSEADRGAPYLSTCDVTVPIGGHAPVESYLVMEKLLDAARRSGAQAIHPGYGFLSEKSQFAAAVIDAGLVFIGPSPDAIALMGDKALARRRMAAAGVPVLPGYDEAAQDDATLSREAKRIGYPVMIKAAAGGGGRGMRLVHREADFNAALQSARSEALNAFGDPRLILERALLKPRHIEVQLFADGHGKTLTLGERDCSIQRRHQKIVEEAPAPGLSAELRARLREAAVRAAESVAYAGAGTVEFLVDGAECFFMEMNTRLQVEHPVTEAITGLDLVEWQFRVARGEALPWRQADITLTGHAIEVRLCAEDPVQDFLPQAGRIERWQAPTDVRVDHAVTEGMVLSPFYDSMLAKVIAHGATREEARRRLRNALEDTVLFGVTSNRHFLAHLVDHPAFAADDVSTAFISEHFPKADSRAIAPDDAIWALAASLSVTPGQAIASEWQGFSSTGVSSLPVRLSHRGRIRTGRMEAFRDGPSRATIDGVTHAIDRHLRFSWHRAGDRVFLQTPEGEWLFEDLRLVAQASGQDAVRDGRLLAPINGRVTHVAALPGERVAKGDALVTIEAMKMEHSLAARVSGTVATLLVSVNEQVSPGKLLLEITPDTDPVIADGTAQ